ncbi:uncharacterized protein EAE98_011909 [Botrytis deweyae]|uniref:Oxidoreductase n=1 Tax=Botrytis deweyae TaxID=2478750 RepID=A0ABQ7I4H3_9HELO|nr:uncharacterized protein EAE98_011909 [Botrytis deweyae]KAF7911645.1 hypothetical protein EAE98_011909 [Botrytis deweyae]
MTFPYKHVLLIGATSGIGLAMAERLVQECKVTIVGRRKDRLDEFVAKHGDQAKSIPFDIGDTEKASQFAADVIESSPDIDCVFLNAGYQRKHDFSKPESVDIKGFNYEMHVNFTSFVVLTHAFLPYLLEKKQETSFIYTTTNLSMVPAVTLTGYSASKAALSSFILCLRDDLRDTSVKVIELSPPMVQTELHNYMGPHGRKLGMPAGEFTAKAYTGLCSGEDTIFIGDLASAGSISDIAIKRRELFEKLAKLIRSH